MEITAKMVKELRDKTGAPMMDCKQALAATEGNLENAVDELRKKGVAAAAKRSGRATAEGAVGSYIHTGGKIGVLLEIACETDFVARTDDFQGLMKDVAMHIAAADPRFVRREQVTARLLEREEAVHREQAVASGKPEQVIERIVTGRMEKFYSENVLLDQAFVKNPDISVGELVGETVGKLGENIQVRRFARFLLGDEINNGAASSAPES